MKFNYTTEKKKFEQQWKKLREEYIQAGWDMESIQLMYDYDHEQFRRERIFCIHNQYLSELSNDIEEGRLPQLFDNNENLSTEMPENPDDSRYGWLQEIEDCETFKVLSSLPAEYLELLTQLAIDELKQVDIAVMSGVSRAAIGKKVSKLRKKLELLQKRG